MALIRAHGLIRDEERLVLPATRHADSAKKSRLQNSIRSGIWELAAHAQGARRGINPVVHEVQNALVRKAGFIGQLQFTGHLAIANVIAFSFSSELLVFENRAFVRVEVAVDRVQGHDRRQKRGLALVGINQIAFRDELPADTPADGRRDMRVFEVQLGHLYGSASEFNRCLSFSFGFTAGVSLLFGDGFRFEQAFGTRELIRRKFEVRLHLCSVRFRPVQFRLIGTGIDHEEQIPFPDLCPVFEVHRFQITTNASPHFDHVNRIEVTRILVPFRHLALGGLVGCDSRRGTRRRRRAGLVAGDS